MKIQPFSDIHLEFSAPDISQVGDIVVMAGDILIADWLTRPDTSSLAPMAKRFDDFMFSFKNVIFVMGNHEHYKGDINKSAGIIRARYPHITLLDNETVEIDGKLIWGGTLWTNFARGNPLAMMTAREQMNDFRVIKNVHRKFLPKDALGIHIQHIRGLRNADIVISHHAPSFQSVDSRYRNSNLNDAYASDLEELILRSNIKLWVHGHMHGSNDYMVGNTRVVSNPRGYNDENENFKKDLIIEL